MKTLTAIQVLFRIAGIIALSEFISMLLLSVSGLDMDGIQATLIDISLLALLSTPLIYLWGIKPFVVARDDALEQINHLANTDPLTHLPNRRLLCTHLVKLIAGTARHKSYGALLLMDLDGFRNINDLYGHAAGDEVLIEIGKRLQANTRSEDVAGRMDGDEFMILMHNIGTVEKQAHDIALRVAEKVITYINQPVNYNGISLYVSASIGINILGTEEISVDTAITGADSALYEAKLKGRGRAMFHKTKSPMPLSRTTKTDFENDQ
jgi:diguanylate cyclase (GGDEF)-like protein